MFPWKSLTRPMSQPARCSWSATFCAEPPGADWFSTSTLARVESGVAVAIGWDAVDVVVPGVLAFVDVPDDVGLGEWVETVDDVAAGVLLELSAAVLVGVRL